MIVAEYTMRRTIRGAQRRRRAATASAAVSASLSEWSDDAGGFRDGTRKK